MASSWPVCMGIYIPQLVYDFSISLLKFSDIIG